MQSNLFDQNLEAGEGAVVVVQYQLRQRHDLWVHALIERPTNETVWAANNRARTNERHVRTWGVRSHPSLQWTTAEASRACTVAATLTAPRSTV
jgi:hypothetical protein